MSVWERTSAVDEWLQIKVPQLFIVNWDALSEKITRGIPRYLIIVFHHNWAIPAVVIFFLQGARRTILVTLSTVTSIVSLLLAVSERSMTKSMEISLHFVSGIWVDCSVPLATV